MTQNYNIRRAAAEDMKAVREMIQELADFEKMSNAPTLTVKDLLRDGGFTSENREAINRPLFICFIIEQISKYDLLSAASTTSTTLLTPKIIGYSLCYYCYSTWQGKSLFMEDLYIKEGYRKLGLGKLLVKKLIEFATNDGCSRLDFHVLDWNPAVEFYNKIGAIDLTSTEGWHFCRFDLKKIVDK